MDSAQAIKTKLTAVIGNLTLLQHIWENYIHDEKVSPEKVVVFSRTTNDIYI